ncbi:hypothetical protein [Polaromonas aquatica]|uniref:hypothetical protein n=1 Tax=Polaromonas aquatica TaxID=332657 RepID=UPI003D65E381
MKNLSNWRSVRVLEGRIERELRQRHSLALHGGCIGLFTLALMWGVSHLQMLAGVDSLALRYFITLGAGYLGYLLVLRFWAAALISRENDGPDEGALDVMADIVDGTDVLSHLPDGRVQMPSLRSGQGGDFGGGGATGDFGSASESSTGLGDAASGALDALGSADEGAVVVIPVVAIFAIGAALFLGAGSLLLLFFGWEVLLAVAVELAFSYVTARATVRMAREGWMFAAVRLTWKPLIGAIACAVALGAAIDHFIPSANSLPQAVKLIRTQGEPGVH